MKAIKPKKCKGCGEPFTPSRPLQMVCSVQCAIDVSKKKQEKIQRKETKIAKEGLLTHKDWMNMLQTVFNTFIRTRDKDRGCICCGNSLGKNYDAGHFYSVGSTPELRINEDNCHAQRVHCNQHLHGNLIEYAEQLPKRIGQERFDKLKELKNIPLKLSIPEIKDLIVYYKNKTKDLITNNQ